jgi:hypothetical protein
MGTFDPWGNVEKPQPVDRPRRRFLPGMVAVYLIFMITVGGIVMIGVGMEPDPPELGLNSATDAHSSGTATARVEARTTGTAQAVASATAEFLPLTPQPDWTWHVGDDFLANPHEWTTGMVESDNGTVDRRLENGRYVWEMHSSANMIAWTEGPAHVPVEDCIYGVDVTQLGGVTLSSKYGILIRALNDQFYFFKLDPAGNWLLTRHEAEGTSSVLAEGNAKEHMRATFSRMTVRVEGNDLHLYVNRRKVGQVQDAAVQSGAMGLAMEVYGDDGFGIVGFDNVSMRCPPVSGE